MLTVLKAMLCIFCLSGPFVAVKNINNNNKKSNPKYRIYPQKKKF